MRLSKYSDYALRVCLYLAVNRGRLVKIAEIAEAHALSQSNLMKVVQKLVAGGLAESTRGSAGGLKLASPPEDIHVGAMVRLMEGEPHLIDCTACTISGACMFPRALAEANIAFYDALDRYTLADAVDDDRRTRAILQSLNNVRSPR
ncbi:RrF2 family transcriptional regulator [Pseudooceanicola sp. 502str34]